MMCKLRIFILNLILTVLIPGVMAYAEVVVNSPAPDFALTDSQGVEHKLTDYKGSYVVLEWVNYDCPFVIKHYGSGNMQSLQKKMKEEGVVWLSINSSAEGKQGCFPPDQINSLMVERSATPTAYLIDKDGMVGKTYEAKTTPHMYIVNPEGTLIYQGAIDSIPSFDVEDIAKAENYVLLAVSEAKAGKALTHPSTTSYGCSVKY